METQKFFSKLGKEITLRVQKNADTAALLEYINTLVDENVDILMNTHVTLLEEEAYVKECSESMKKEESLHVVAMDGDVLVGKSDVKRESYKERHIAGFGISLKNGYRSLGIGRRLAEVVLDWAKEHPEIEKVYLTVFGSNEQAIGLYKKLGFQEFGRMPDGIQSNGKYADRVYMYLDTRT